MPDADLGPKPEAKIEPGEPNPGGADAIEGSDGVDGEAAGGNPIPADLDPQDNPATQAEPAEVKEDDETSTEATEKGEEGQESGEDAEAGTEMENPE